MLIMVIISKININAYLKYVCLHKFDFKWTALTTCT